MKFSLLSLKAFDEKVLKSATTGSRTEKGLYPKMAAVALLTWLEKNGYSQDDYDFYDLDMLLPNE